MIGKRRGNLAPILRLNETDMQRKKREKEPTEKREKERKTER